MSMKRSRIVRQRTGRKNLNNSLLESFTELYGKANERQRILLLDTMMDDEITLNEQQTFGLPKGTTILYNRHDKSKDVVYNITESTHSSKPYSLTMEMKGKSKERGRYTTLDEVASALFSYQYGESISGTKQVKTQKMNTEKLIESFNRLYDRSNETRKINLVDTMIEDDPKVYEQQKYSIGNESYILTNETDRSKDVTFSITESAGSNAPYIVRMKDLNNTCKFSACRTLDEAVKTVVDFQYEPKTNPLMLNESSCKSEGCHARKRINGKMVKEYNISDLNSIKANAKRKIKECDNILKNADESVGRGKLAEARKTKKSMTRVVEICEDRMEYLRSLRNKKDRVNESGFDTFRERILSGDDQTPKTGEREVVVKYISDDALGEIDDERIRPFFVCDVDGSNYWYVDSGDVEVDEFLSSHVIGKDEEKEHEDWDAYFKRIPLPTHLKNFDIEDDSPIYKVISVNEDGEETGISFYFDGFEPSYIYDTAEEAVEEYKALNDESDDEEDDYEDETEAVEESYKQRVNNSRKLNEADGDSEDEDEEKTVGEEEGDSSADDDDLFGDISLDDTEDETSDDEKKDDDSSSDDEDEVVELANIILEVTDTDKVIEELKDYDIPKDGIEVVTASENDEDGENITPGKIRILGDYAMQLKEYLQSKGIDLEEEIGGTLEDTEDDITSEDSDKDKEDDTPSDDDISDEDLFGDIDLNDDEQADDTSDEDKQ